MTPLTISQAQDCVESHERANNFGITSLLGNDLQRYPGIRCVAVVRILRNVCIVGVNFE